jgi:hypothetical protein
MQKIIKITFLITIFLFSLNFKGKYALAQTNEQSIINAAKHTVQKVFDASNNLRFLDGLNYYSNDADAYYINNGTILSLDDLKVSYRQIGSSVEELENTIGVWKAKVVSNDTVIFTLPVRLKIKLSGVPEYSGNLVWSGVVQKRGNKWIIIHSHESWLNCVEAASALTPSE